MKMNKDWGWEEKEERRRNKMNGKTKKKGKKIAKKQE